MNDQRRAWYIDCRLMPAMVLLLPPPILTAWPTGHRLSPCVAGSSQSMSCTACCGVYLHGMHCPYVLRVSVKVLACPGCGLEPFYKFMVLGLSSTASENSIDQNSCCQMSSEFSNQWFPDSHIFYFLAFWKPTKCRRQCRPWVIAIHKQLGDHNS